MANLGTGFLYSFGNGVSGENLIPSEITGLPFSGISAGTQIAGAIYNSSLNQTTLVSQIVNKKNIQFGFGIFNKNYNRSPVSKIEFTSSFSGLGTGTFVSGDSFQRNIIIVTQSADSGISIDRAILNLGASLGTGSGIYKYPSDTYVSSIKNNLSYLSSDSWLEYSGFFNSYNITGIASGDGGFIIKDLGGNFGAQQNFNLYEINYGSKDIFQNTDIVRQKLIINNLGVNFPQQEIKSSNNKAWASYDITSGTNNSGQNVFAYSFEFVDIATIRDSGVIINSESTSEDSFASYRKLLTPELITGFDTSFFSYIGYCFNRLSCDSADTDENEDIQICYTGSSTTGKEYADFLSGVLKQFSSTSSTAEFDAISNAALSSGESISGLFVLQTGQIFYNSFFTGDSINFNLYNFDYTGLYKSYHLNNDPLFPPTGFSLFYPQDFTGIDSLITKLNQKLNNINYPVWYPYECLSGQSSGIYITGAIMFFEKNTGILSGDKNYNNVIDFKSLRNYQKGFDLNLNLVNRDEYLDNINKQIFRQGFSYLIPNVIELQALTGNQWLVLDRRSGMYDALTGIPPTKKTLNASPKLFTENYLSSSDITGVTPVEDLTLEEVLYSGGFTTLQKFRQSGVTPGAPYCPQQTFVKEISIVQPTGWPVGKDPCKDPSSLAPSDKKEEEKEKEEGALELFLEVKRTGWLLEPTGTYLSCLTSPDYDLSKISFPKYRIVAKDFSGLLPSIENQYIIPTNEIYFTNINLFGLNSAPIGTHTGQAQCLIGSDYVVDVEDIIGFPFTTNFEYSIPSEDRSGVYRALNQPVIYTPTSGERNVKFVRSSGTIISNVTGLVNGIFSGSGVVSHTFGDRYFYDPSSKEISFRKILTGDFLRSGILSGDSIALKDFVVNEEILVGGRLNSTPIYAERISGGLFNGLLTGVSYVETGVTGLYLLTGSISGVSNSGYFIFNTGVSGSGVYVDDDNSPYYPIPTGYTQASGIVLINYNEIQNFDLISINNANVNYHTNTGAYFAPDYFYNTDSLIEIINSSPTLFNCSGLKLNNTGILLTANDQSLGSIGNNIILTGSSTGITFSFNTLTGGKTFYPRLYPTTLFSGIANGIGAATGFYYVSASGFITGNVPTFTGTRTFTGVWGLQTGQDFDFTSFLANGFISGDNKYYNNTLFTGTTTFMQILAQYTNELNTDEDDILDVVDIKIQDLNYNLIFPTGDPNNTGVYNFRITGIKNL